MPRSGSTLAAALLFAASCTDAVNPDRQVTAIVVTPKTARIWIVGDSAKFSSQVTTATGTDSTSVPVSWISRDPSLVTVTGDGLVKSLKKGGSTYVVATAGGKSDSALVEVPLTPCGTVTATNLSVGEVAHDIGATGFCVADIPGAEYTVIAHNMSSVAASLSTIEVIGQALGTPPATQGAALTSRVALPRPTGLSLDRRLPRDTHGEMVFREAETALLAPRVADAQRWYKSRSQRALNAAAVPAVGDLLTVNVSMGTSCAQSSRVDHVARVAAVSNSAIILDDQANPTGGFTDAEYANFATVFDTLVNPLDTLTFGAPTDLDGNGRVMILFTRAINELTPPNSDSYTGGRTMSRDLFPGVSDGVHSGCPASNVGEIFYMLVPDPNYQVNGNTDFTKDFVAGQTMVTIAHEYQHMINIGRRMYLLGLSSDKWMDEIWLHEGLSHMAEELLFYKASGLPKRSNIGLDMILATQRAQDAFNAYMVGDFFLYDSYVSAPATASPYAQNDNLPTRGATWSFMRYAADRSGRDGDLWHRLVNSGLIGLTNLETELNLTPASFQAELRDFEVSVYADDYVGVATIYTQPGWNMRSIYPGINDPNFTWPLPEQFLTENTPIAAALTGGGFTVYRFTALPGSQAFIRPTGTAGGQLPPNISLSVLRTQ